MLRMLTAALLVLLGFAPARPGVAQDPSEAPGEPARIEGQVVAAGTGSPLAGVRVRVLSILPAQVREAVTGESGMFVFEGLGPGLHTFEIEREGYVQASREVFPDGGDLRFGTGRVTPAGEGRFAVDLGVGERFSLRVRMVRGAVITGRVLDSEREPVAGARVELLVPEYYDEITGVRDSVEPTADPVTTDEAGEYRFDGVVPGRYYIRAMAGAPTANRIDAYGRERQASRVDAMSATYFPGFPDLASAASIDAVAESEVHADVVLVRFSPRRVSGEVVNPVAFGDERVDYRFYLVARTGGRTEIFGELPDYDPDLDRFELGNIRPGAYELVVVYEPVTGDGRIQNPSVGQSRIEVGDRDVRDLVLTIEPNMPLEGEIVLDPTAADRVPDPTQLNPMLTLAEGMPRPLSLNPMLQRLRVVAPDQTFTIPDVPRVRYRASVMQHTLPEGVYVASVRLNGREVLGFPFEVEPGTDGPLVFELRGDGGSFGGVVRDPAEGAPAVNARVVLVPTGSWRDEPTAYRTAVTDWEGAFAVDGIRPGAYTAYAFRDIPFGAWLNDGFMAPWLTRGVPVSIRSYENVAHELEVISR